MRNTWSSKTSLTPKELDCLNNISSLFNPKPSPQIIEETKIVQEKEKVLLKEIKEVNKEDELNVLIQDA